MERSVSQPDDSVLAMLAGTLILLLLGAAISFAVVGCRAQMADSRRIQPLTQTEHSMFEARYSTHQDKTDLGGFTSWNSGSQIQWRGSKSKQGVSPIEVLEAVMHRLHHEQQTDLASEDNAKLLFDLTVAVEKFNGAPPSMGGDLNNLIPDLDDGDSSNAQGGNDDDQEVGSQK